VDSIEISIFKNMFQSISDEMGEILRLSALSPNIRERMDFSCALFTVSGESFAFGSHIPVHLGAMPMSVQEVLDNHKPGDGDTIMLNDPFKGGTHLPDITMVSPVYVNNKPEFYVANRAHHSDVGGMQAGSMPLASEIFQEGMIIPPVRITKKNSINREVLDMLLANVRTPEERKGDILAQIASNQRGIQRIKEFVEKYGLKKIKQYSSELINYTEKLFLNFLKSIPEGEYSGEDILDDDGFGRKNIKIRLKLTVKKNELIFDFSKSDPQTRGGLNANKAISFSAVLYVLNTLLRENIPINSGVMRPVKLILKKGSILNPERSAAMAGGNVETSQRITDVIFKTLSSALKNIIPAASQGTMNNISFGIKGSAYYETIGGGAGASPFGNGISAVHSHMTNSLNTPVEIIERDYPVLINQYSIRKDSGGSGKFIGGNGIVREYKFLKDMSVSLLTERRKHPPWGLFGGRDGKTGENILIRKGKKIKLDAKLNLEIRKGDILRIMTPGGGGYGEKK